MDWKAFWQTYPAREAELDLFQQVGKTRHGKAISDTQFDLLLKDIRAKLSLEPSDDLLDIGCGNGLITCHLANYVSEVVGLDFSDVLIDTANRLNQARNCSYVLHDAKRLGDFADKTPKSFNKVLCYEALSFFNETELTRMLQELQKILRPPARIFLGSVLDRGKKFRFFNTIPRKMIYVKMVLTGKDFGLGKWWNMENIRTVAEAQGFRCQIFEQPTELHTAHFRTDLLLTLDQKKYKG
jgi:cyclopropane fatty-acyl-phospholipid synthase-like methyltransferase